MKTTRPSQSFRSNRLAVVIILIIVAVLGALALNRHKIVPAPSAAPETLAEVKGKDFDTVWNYALNSGKENYAVRWGDVESDKWGTITPGPTYTIPTARCRQYTLRTVTKAPAAKNAIPADAPHSEESTRSVTAIEYGRACTSQGSAWQKVQ